MSGEQPVLADAHVTAWARLVRVSEGILQTAGNALKEAGLPPLHWYDLLLELRRAEPDGLRPYQLQSALLLPQYNTSRLIDRVVRAGYAERGICEDDGRGQIVRVTAKGKALQRKMWPIYRAVLEREFGSKLSVREAETLAKLLHPLLSP